LAGLQRLEYRGYDSAGVATLSGDRMHIRKAVGRISKLASVLTNQPAPAPTLEEAEETPITPLQRMQMSGMMQNIFAGTVEKVVADVRAFASETRADEVMITSILASEDDRLRTIRAFHQEWTGNAPVESSQPASSDIAAPTPEPILIG
jgi:alkanesulfonate monooxygenase SsuD/methylene tetrahydromethanopterin reductase-like flavin-dependent oxidoreductase (luciferase family)